mgnify:CR=1 FL=1
MENLLQRNILRLEQASMTAILMYQTYDVTDLVQEGWNGLGCVLASGWWSDSFSFRLHNYNYWVISRLFLEIGTYL